VQETGEKVVCEKETVGREMKGPVEPWNAYKPMRRQRVSLRSIKKKKGGEKRDEGRLSNLGGTHMKGGLRPEN